VKERKIRIKNRQFIQGGDFQEDAAGRSALSPPLTGNKNI